MRLVDKMMVGLLSEPEFVELLKWTVADTFIVATSEKHLLLLAPIPNRSFVPQDDSEDFFFGIHIFHY